MKRLAIALLFALPGIGLALVAKPLRLGEATLVLGVVLAFAVPLLWRARGAKTSLKE